MVENIGATEAVLEAKPKARLYGASGLNVWNHMTIKALSPYLQHLTLSPELSCDQLARTVAAARQIDRRPEAGAVGAGQPGSNGHRGLHSLSRQEENPIQETSGACRTSSASSLYARMTKEGRISSTPSRPASWTSCPRSSGSGWTAWPWTLAAEPKVRPGDDGDLPESDNGSPRRDRRRGIGICRP